MRNISWKTDAFLREIGMHPDFTDIAVTASAFRARMDAGLRALPGGLPMLPTFLRAEGRIPDGEPVIVLDAGGTQLRRAVVVFREGRPVISHLESMAMPGSRHEISWEEFLTQTAMFLLPMAHLVRHIAFCFSYPAEILPDFDGRLISFCKELRVKGGVGCRVGAGLLARLRECVYDRHSFLLLNDAASVALGGRVILGGLKSPVGLVLGTGFNICCPIRGEDIKKIPGAGDMLINLEAGCFDAAARGLPDRLLDEESEKTGDHLLEKMVSGAYLGDLIALTASLCAGKGLLPECFVSVRKFSLADTEALAMGLPSALDGLCQSEDARRALYTVVDRSYERAGRLLCACLLAVASYACADKSSPLFVALEGTTILRSKTLQTKLRSLAAEHITGRTGVVLDFITGEALTMTGAAAASLMHRA